MDHEALNRPGWTRTELLNGGMGNECLARNGKRGKKAAQESGTIMLIKKMINAAGGFVMLE